MSLPIGCMDIIAPYFRRYLNNTHTFCKATFTTNIFIVHFYISDLQIREGKLIFEQILVICISQIRYRQVNILVLYSREKSTALHRHTYIISQAYYMTFVRMDNSVGTNACNYIMSEQNYIFRATDQQNWSTMAPFPRSPGLYVSHHNLYVYSILG